MNFYLSSYKLGNEVSLLKSLISKTKKDFAYIPNALDFVGADKKRRQEHIKSDMDDLKKFDVNVQLLDLKNYFDKKDALKEELNILGGIYVSGGNTFVLMQAMKLSGLDEIILANKLNNNFLYIAYSAGVCLLAPSLKQYSITDDAKNFPYKQIKSQIWHGLGIIDFVFEPHFKSNHPESASTDKEIEFLIKNKILFKAYKDGEVFTIER